MNHGSIDADQGIPSSPYGISLGNGVPPPYQQSGANFGSSASLHSTDLNRSMHSMSVTGKSGSLTSTKAEDKNRNNFPVKYRIAWNKASSAFTITLLVPKHGQTPDGKAKPKSPFQLVDDGKKIESGKETHMLRIPLSYLVNLSNQSSTTQQQQAAPWLDRSTLRGRLNDGGKSVGLEMSHVYQVIAAVEESATRIAEWAPAHTESVSADVLLSDGTVSLVAKVSSISMYPPSRSQSFHGSDVDFKYNVLNESSGSLVATAPSFTGDSALSRSFTGQSDQFSKSDAPRGSLVATAPSFTGDSALSRSFPGQGDQFSKSDAPGISQPGTVSSFSRSSTDSDLFTSPKGSLSTFSPWEAEQGAGRSRREFAQEIQGQNTIGMDMNPYSAPSTSQPVNLPSSNHPVNANQLFPAPASDVNRSISTGNSPVARQGQRHPDPSIIAEPLLSMGFTRAQCDAAIAAIRNLSPDDSVPGMSSDELDRTTRSQASSSLGNSNHQGFNQNQVEMQRQHQRQVSGEDILGYVLNSDSSAFEQNMASAEVADSYDQHVGTSPLRDSLSVGSLSKQSDEMSEKDSMNGSWAFNGVQNAVPRQNGPVWGNAGKLKLVKSSGAGSPLNSTEYASEALVTDDVKDSESSNGNDANWNGSSPSQKMVKVLDIPSDMNAFVFHCNSQTREECLERGLFGLVPCVSIILIFCKSFLILKCFSSINRCPSGGQYGPHSKAKKGDLLFLADFSAWTVTGIFTAKTDAGLNHDKLAWNGRFPWQIKVDAWNELRTVHIDKVNEIIGLASGSKLNMLTKDQLAQLVLSKEFAPCVPPHLFKVKNVPQTPSAGLQVSDRSAYTQNPEQKIQSGGGSSALGMNGIKYTRIPSTTTSTDEHPATAMHRLKLVTSWFDTMASELLMMNELFNNKKPSSKKDSKDKVVLDDNIIEALRSCRADAWPLMSYSHVRRAIADVFDQWLMLAHTSVGQRTKAGNSGDKSTNGSWTRQQGRSSSTHGKIKEDIVLLVDVPGATSFVQHLMQTSSGTSAVSLPSSLAELVASKFVREIEHISTEVRKTQLSLMKIGGDSFMKSIEDKALGMKAIEAEAKIPNGDVDMPGRKIVKIEWHTKSSIAQGRPPQVQKVSQEIVMSFVIVRENTAYHFVIQIYKTHFDVLERSYRKQSASDDPGSSHFLTRLFVLLCRHELLGDLKHRCQATIPTIVQNVMTTQFGIAHECFASPLSNSRASFNTFLFTDVCKFFGGLGSFFDFFPIEGKFDFVNMLNQICDHSLTNLCFYYP